jgi:hypothetical protein
MRLNTGWTPSLERGGDVGLLHEAGERRKARVEKPAAFSALKLPESAAARGRAPSLRAGRCRRSDQEPRVDL